MDISFARAIQFDQHDGLPGSENQFASQYGKSEGRTKNRRGHVRPCVRRVMGMAEDDLRDHLLYDLKEILLGSFADLPSRQRGSRMGNTEEAKAHLDFPVRNDCV